MWIVNGDAMPPQHRLLRYLGPVEATATLALTSPGSDECRRAWQTFLDRVPTEANVVTRFRVDTEVRFDVDGPVLCITFRGWAGIGRYVRRKQATGHPDLERRPLVSYGKSD